MRRVPPPGAHVGSDGGYGEGREGREGQGRRGEGAQRSELGVGSSLWASPKRGPAWHVDRWLESGSGNECRRGSEGERKGIFVHKKHKLRMKKIITHK